MNIIIHSFGGRLRVDIYPDRLIMVAEDNGPGIEDLEKAMEEGYSTAPEEPGKWVSELVWAYPTSRLIRIAWT